jgi:hypothetical protein
MVALFLILKGMTGALAPFSYLVHNIKIENLNLTFALGGRKYQKNLF